MTYWIVRVIVTVLAFIIWGFFFHERGWKRGYAAGHDKGVKEGYEAGKSHADNWWIHTESEIDQVRQKMRKEGWP
jgi:hypothetical protein